MVYLLTYTIPAGSTNSLRDTNSHTSELSVGSRIVTPLGFRPNSIFVGFAHELDQLHAKLQNKKRRELGTCSVLVWGDVGAGKTHLVRQYFYQYRSDYPEGCFWVDGKSKGSILSAYWDIGMSIGLGIEKSRTGTPPPSDDFIDAVRKRLEILEGWILVLDGISFESEEDLDRFIRFLPDRSGNSIIFTSVDRTLVKRQRLLNPSAVRVKALTIPEACELLFKNLSIRKPSEQQQAKAVALVQDYQCLPLAVHAASHALIEKGKALENYSRGISDPRLIAPFLEILSALREKQHFEAINLLVILSFFNHIVPVKLVRYGYKGLRLLKVDVLSPKHPGSAQRDLDSTITILMRSGLLERTLQAYPRSDSGQASPEESRAPRRTANGTLPAQSLVRVQDSTPRSQVTEESSGLDLVLARLNSETDHSSISSHTSTIDVLRVHTVVQKAIRDDLKDRSSEDQSEFWWWLATSVRLLTHSFDVGIERMRKFSGHGLVRDYREYDVQGRRLWSFFPKSPKDASPTLRAARHQLHDLLRFIRREIQTQSPSQSSDSSRTRFQGSIFDESSGTSEDEPRTPTSDELARAPTWTPEPARPPSESPTSMYHPGRDEIDARWDYESAVETDEGSWPSDSDHTEIPSRREDITRRNSVLHAIFEGKPKQHKDLGEWKPMPAPPSLSQPDIKVLHPRTTSTASSEHRPGRPLTASSGAEAALAAVHRNSPPAPRGGRIRSTSRGSATFSDRPGSIGKKPSGQLSPLASEFSPSEKYTTSSSSSPSRAHSRHPSASPRMMQALLTNRAQASRGDLPPMQIEQISLAYPRMASPRPSSTTTRPQYSSSLGASSYLPTGYTSLPMSRDVSRETEIGIPMRSNQQPFNIGSAPSRAFSDFELAELDQQMYSLNALDAAAGFSPATAAERAQDRFDRAGRGDRQDLAFGRCDEYTDMGASPVTPVFSPAPWKDEPNAAEAGAVRFGGMEPVKLEDARRRVALERERSSERARMMVREGDARKMGREHKSVGLGIQRANPDEEGRGIRKEKENVPLG